MESQSIGQHAHDKTDIGNFVIEERIDTRTGRDFHLSDDRIWKPYEVGAILAHLEGIMAPLVSPTIT